MLINLSTIIGVFLGVLLGVFVSTLLFRNKVKILKSNLEKTNNELKSTKIEAQADLEMVEAYWSTRLSEEKAKDKKHYEAALADKDKANDEAMQILREYCEYLLRIQRDEGGVLDQIADKDHKIAWLAYQVDRLKWQLVLAYREELEPFMQCYIEKKKATDRQTAEENQQDPDPVQPDQNLHERYEDEMGQQSRDQMHDQEPEKRENLLRPHPGIQEKRKLLLCLQMGDKENQNKEKVICRGGKLPAKKAASSDPFRS